MVLEIEEEEAVLLLVVGGGACLAGRWEAAAVGISAPLRSTPTLLTLFQVTCGPPPI